MGERRSVRTIAQQQPNDRGRSRVKPNGKNKVKIVPGRGGFNKRARDFASAKRNLKPIDGDELVDLVYKYYSQLDAKYRWLIPLRQAYIPETLTE